MISHEYLHTEEKYYTANERPFIFLIKVNFSELSCCERRHQPVMTISYSNSTTMA